MNLKSIMTGAAIVASVSVGSAVVAAPTNAAVLNFGDTVRIQGVGGGTGPTVRVNFSPLSNTTTGTAEIGAPTTGFFGPVGTTITLQDLVLDNAGLNVWTLATPVTGFIQGLGGGTITFDLSSFRLTRILPTLTDDGGFSATYSGIFSNLPGDVYGGSLTTQLTATGNGGALFSSTVAVPTPALLPGLVGLGVAALRKRKGEGAEAEKETVGVKA
jgi:hypothetical protein